MRAQWMAVCSAAATTSEITNNKELAIEITLLNVSAILGQVADDLDPVNLLRPPTVAFTCLIIAATCPTFLNAVVSA